MKRKTICLVIMLIVISFLIGCTQNVRPNATLPQKPLIEKLPITVGVYYSNEFQSYERVHSMPQVTGVNYKVVLGPPSVSLFDQILSEMFEKVVLVDSLPPLAQTEADIKAVIEPKIVQFTTDAQLEGFRPSQTWVQFDISYAINLYDPNNVLIASWQIKGSGTVTGSLKYPTIAPMVQDAAQIAMVDMAEQFMIGFRKNREVMKWLRGFGITASY